MDEKEIRDSLERLRSELGALRDDDGPVRQRLNGIIDGIEKQIGGSEDAPAPGSLVDRISETLEEFEIEHPKILSILGNLMNSLGNMGI